MSALEKLNIEFEENENISLEGLITLYQSTLQKLKECAQYIPSEDLEYNLQNSKKEVSQFLLQDKIMNSVLEQPVTQISDIKTFLDLWKLSALSFKSEADYDCSDFVILKLIAYLDESKI